MGKVITGPVPGPKMEITGINGVVGGGAEPPVVSSVTERSSIEVVGSVSSLVMTVLVETNQGGHEE